MNYTYPIKEDEEVLLTTDDLLSRYKLDKQTQKILRERECDPMPFKKIGKRIYYVKIDIDAWVGHQTI
ncbi:MAG TPA: hypothetical protein CFH81_02275 [Sulfurovum sp. UBA12169]|nr:MAG TPA: hypothetical protein CFH81_02275 [Sulfurovum sp. UBA12169]